MFIDLPMYISFVLLSFIYTTKEALNFEPFILVSPTPISSVYLEYDSTRKTPSKRISIFNWSKVTLTDESLKVVSSILGGCFHTYLISQKKKKIRLAKGSFRIHIKDSINGLICSSRPVDVRDHKEFYKIFKGYEKDIRMVTTTEFLTLKCVILK